MHVPTTGYEVAHQEAALGMLVEARDMALRVTRLPAEAHEPAPFDAKMLLGNGERIGATHLRHLYTFDRLPISNDKMRIR